MKYAFVDKYSISVALPNDYHSETDGVPYIIDWDGLVRGGEEYQQLLDRIGLLMSQGKLPLVAVFAPRK